MQLYETIYIVKQDLDNKALKDLEEKYENLLNKLDLFSESNPLSTLH